MNNRIRSFSFAGLVAMLCCFFLTGARAQNSTSPGLFESYSTFLCIGFEWNLTGDEDHDATCPVQYKVAGAGVWKDAMPLMRTDWSHGPTYNQFAGSIFNLTPGTLYDVKLSLIDPDGGSQEKTVTVSTRAYPVLPTGGREFHVVPGAGGGTGSQADPFKGFESAHAVAQPGDIFKLHKGNYGSAMITKSGTPGNYIAWIGAGDGDACFEHLSIGRHPSDAGNWYLPQDSTDGNHIWLEGLKFIPEANYPNKKDMDNQGFWSRNLTDIDANGNPVQIDSWPQLAPQSEGERWTNVQDRNCMNLVTADVEDLVITKNVFEKVQYPIYASRSAWTHTRNFYIADNLFLGDSVRLWAMMDPMHGAFAQIWGGQGHVFCHNSVTKYAYAVVFGSVRNCDIYGNDVWTIDGDVFKGQQSLANMRFFENRVNSGVFHCFSMQNMGAAPWYIIRNQVITPGCMFKYRGQERHMIANNLFIGWGWLQYRAENLFYSVCKNNFWIMAGPVGEEATPTTPAKPENPYIFWSNGQNMNDDGFPGIVTPGWQTDMDYDGFDWGNLSQPFQWPTSNGTFVGMKRDIGIERHAIQVKKEEIFDNYNAPFASNQTGEVPTGNYIAPQYITLKVGANPAVDAGTNMPNITDGYAGTAPDLGPYESGAPLPHYGPRQYAVRTGPNWYNAEPIGIQGKPDRQSAMDGGLFLGSLQSSALSHSFQYNVPQSGLVQIRVHNLLGQEVCSLLNKEITAGMHTVNWDGKDATGKMLADGVYAIRMQANGQSISKKMVMIR